MAKSKKQQSQTENEHQNETPALLVPYSSTLFKSESGQIPNEKLMKIKQVTDELKQSIENIIQLTQNENESSTVLPSTLVKRLNKELREKLTSELTTYEVQAITALVVLIHKAYVDNKLSYFAQTQEGYVAFTLNDYYEAVGLLRDKKGKFSNKNQKDYALKALLSLHYKHFFVPYETKKSIKIRSANIVRIHEIEILKKEIEREKGTTIKVTVSSMFFDFEPNQQNIKKVNNDHYFHVPANLNSRIRQMSNARLSAGTIMLVKAIYHNRHFALRAGNHKIEFALDKLIDIMNLNKHVERRQMKRAETAIEKGLQLAKKMRLIQNVEKTTTKTGKPKYILRITELDPECQLELKI